MYTSILAMNIAHEVQTGIYWYLVVGTLISVVSACVCKLWRVLGSL